MRLSLRTLLLGGSALGATLGLMAGLLVERPEKFFQVLNLISTVVPFLLAIATLIWIGFRRQPFWSAPVCANCKLSLRDLAPQREPKCPECGADLEQPGAVLFAAGRERRWRLVAWASLLLLMPAIAPVVYSVFGSNPLRVLASRRLIQQRLPSKLDEPWVWEELEYRLQNASLSQPQVEEALQELIAHMKSTRPKGWNQPLPWQKKFIGAAILANSVSDEVFFDLCDAFFGPPVIKPLPPVWEAATGFPLEFHCGNPWAEESGLGVKLVWELKQVRLDGTPMKTTAVSTSTESWNGRCQADLQSGEHEVAVEVECAYVDQRKLTGVDLYKLTAAQWPPARRRWTQTVKIPLQVGSSPEKEE